MLTHTEFGPSLVILEELSHLKSRSEKLDLLKVHLQDPVFRELVRFTLDPYITFGIRGYDLDEDTRVNLKDPFFTFLEKLASREYVGIQAREIAGQYVLVDPTYEQVLQIVLGKNLKCGVGAAIVNEASPGLISDFPIMLADTYNPEKAKWPMAGCDKYDGNRGLALCDTPENVTLRTRSGLPAHGALSLIPALVKLREAAGQPMMFDGELVCGDLHQTTGSARRLKNPEVSWVFYIFDCLPLPIFLTKQPWKPLEERLAYLHDLMKGCDPSLIFVEHQVIENADKAQDFYQSCLERGFEGSMFKKLRSQYEYKRSSTWLKYKPEDTVDVKVLRAIEGRGQFKGMLGAFVVEHDGVIDQIGSGFEVWERQKYYDELPQVIEVQYQGKTPDGHFRHGRFNKVRDDKA